MHDSSAIFSFRLGEQEEDAVAPMGESPYLRRSTGPWSGQTGTAPRSVDPLPDEPRFDTWTRRIHPGQNGGNGLS
jgi:hypothetical protein